MKNPKTVNSLFILIQHSYGVIVGGIIQTSNYTGFNQILSISILLVFYIGIDLLSLSIERKQGLKGRPHWVRYFITIAIVFATIVGYMIVSDIKWEIKY